MIGHLRSGVVLLVAMTVLTGVLYPLAVTGFAMAVFPEQAAGSLVRAPGGAIAGSLLIGQEWTSDGYFHGRPSATSPPYNAAASSGSNLGPTNPALASGIAERSASLGAQNPGVPVPPDLLVASGSGLDPHITLEAAHWQVPRVARARGLTENQVRAVVDAHVHRSDLGLFDRVTVLEVNLALDAR